MEQNYINISITSNDLGKRIDLAIVEKIDKFSRNRIQHLISSGCVSINNKKIYNRAFKIKNVGQINLVVPPPEKYFIEPKKINLDILFEDENLIVINKKPGLVVHPAAGNYENTLVNALLFHCKGNLSEIGGYKRPGIVHRIDKMTSGAIVVAKNDLTHNFLTKQFQKRTILKEYYAICNMLEFL